MITTSQNDIILAGHGSYLGGSETLLLPVGVELCIMQPVGSALTVVSSSVLLMNKPVERAVLKQPSGRIDDFEALGLANGSLYKPGERAPDLVLHDLGDLKPTLESYARAGRSHVVYVNSTRRISDILNENSSVKSIISAAVRENRVVRLYWCACTDHGAKNPEPAPLVAYNAQAIAWAADTYANENKSDASASRAAEAAAAVSRQRVYDTQGAIKAAAQCNEKSANLLKPL